MKIETARNIIDQHLNSAIPDAEDARAMLKQYDCGQRTFHQDPQLEMQIYQALSLISCTDMGRDHRADPKRQQRKAAERRKERLNIR